MQPLIYRRAVRLQRRDNQVVSEMEDDFHHFRVTIEHDASRLLEVRGESLRFPWTTCGAAAAAELSRLAGLRLEPLREQLSAPGRWRHCTHLFDLVEYAIAQVAAPNPERLFQISVQLSPGEGAIAAELQCDFQPRLAWRIEGGTIRAPEPFAGVAVSDVARWAVGCAGADSREVAMLQRAVHVSFGKIYDWSFARTAADMQLAPTCFTLAESNAVRAVPVADHVRDYTDNPQAMLSGGIAERDRGH